MKRVLWITLSIALLGGMAFSIIGLVTRGSPTVPRPPDRANAGRLIVPPAGSPEATVGDFRDALLPAAGGAAGATLIGGNGVVEPAHEEIHVAGEVAGRIARVAVKEGDRVAAGDVLLTLEDATEKASLAIAEAELEQARVRLERQKEGSRGELVREAIARSREAKARADLSREVLERTQRLAEAGAATEDELGRKKREAEADAFAANAADAARAAVVNGNRAEDIAEAEAEVRIAEARVTEARARVEERVVRAPEAGEVLQVKVRAGEYLATGLNGAEAPIVLGDTRQLTVRVDVDERDFAKVVVGASARVTARAFGDRVFQGHVRELGRRMGRKNLRTDDPTERNDTKILEVVIALDTFDGLVVGQRVSAMIDVAGGASAR